MIGKVFFAVKSVIKNGDKFLIIKQSFKNKEVWDLPGGRVEYGENPYKALIREVEEEVSLIAKIVKPLGLFWFFRYDNDQVICSVFLCDVENYNVDLSGNPANENIVAYEWVTKNEFMRALLHKSSSEFNIIVEIIKQN